MGSVNDSKGGFLGDSPSQNTSTHPGTHSQIYFSRERREGRWPGEAAGGSLVSSALNSSDEVLITFAAPSGTGIVGNNGTNITIVGNLGTTNLVVGSGTSGSGWSISAFVLNISNASIASASDSGSFTVNWGNDTFVTTDSFSVASGSVTAEILPKGSSSLDAAGSAKALQGAGITSSGTYWIKNGTGSSVRQMYCDMTTDGGGWTRYANINAGSPPYNFRYSNTNYNVSSSSPNVDTDHYVAHNYRIGRESYSDDNLLEYLFEVQNGAYKFKLNAYHNNDPRTGIGRGLTHIAGNLNSHFDAGWFNSNSNGYWYGPTSITTATCSSSTNVVHYVNGAATGSGGYFSVNRGYKSECCKSTGCGDHCPNTRKYWHIFPFVSHSQHCYNGYSSISGFSGGGRISVYYRERGTIPSAGL